MNIDTYVFNGLYFDSEPSRKFNLELELIEGGDPFAFAQQDLSGLIDIPLHGRIYDFKDHKELFLHNDINNRGERSLIYYLKLNKNIDGPFTGIVFLDDVEIGYSGLLKLIYGERKYLSLANNLNIRSSVIVPVLGIVNRC